MHKNVMKCNETLSKWCKNKHGASKIIDTFETYQGATIGAAQQLEGHPVEPEVKKLRVQPSDPGEATGEEGKTSAT
jgi:hypothetical protein